MTNTATIIETNRTSRDVKFPVGTVLTGRGVTSLGGILYRLTDTAFEAMKAEGWTFKQTETASWH